MERIAVIARHHCGTRAVLLRSTSVLIIELRTYLDSVKLAW